MCPMRYILPHCARGIAIDGILWPLTVPDEFHEKDFVGQIHMELGVRVWKHLILTLAGNDENVKGQIEKKDSERH